MDFRLTEEQELLIQSLEELLEREAPESLMAELDEKHEFPHKPWQALADNGILSLGIPEEYGGTPADILTQTLVCETLGKHAFTLGIIYALGMITIRDIVQYGSDEIKEKVLTGFDMLFAGTVTTTAEPTDEELHILREEVDPTGRVIGKAMR